MIKIKIPFKTPTVNHLYGHFQNRIYVKNEAKALRELIKGFVQHYIQNNEVLINSNQKLEVEVEIYENWYNKDGTVKKKDIANREKFLIDSVFNAFGLEDKYIFKHTMIKVQSDEEYAVVIIK